MNSSENTLVSVLLPAYNAEKYLAEAIESVLSQTYTRFEFIIINDGSTDSTEQIINSFNDTRICYIKNETNIGLIATLNKGIALAKGKYLMRMDADDICFPLRMEKQVLFLNQNPEYGICGCNYIEFDNSHKKLLKTSADHDEIYATMLFNSSVVHPSLMIRLETIKNLTVIFDSNYPHAEDYELWSRLIAQCKFSSINEALLKYRLHEGQVTQKHKAAQIQSANLVRKNILKSTGFVFSEEELRVHCLLGSSQLLQTIEELQTIEIWLKSLIKQNNTLKVIDSAVFEKVILKQWYDACGITTLGLKAFRTYFKSDLKSRNYSKIKLLIKCLVRRWAR